VDDASKQRLICLARAAASTQRERGGASQRVRRAAAFVTAGHSRKRAPVGEENPGKLLLCPRFIAGTRAVQPLHR